MAFIPTYSPKDSLEKLKLIKELSDNIHDMRNINVLLVENKIATLQQKVISDIEKDFDDNLQLYSFMVSNKIEKNYFPFYEWLTYFEEVEKKKYLKLNIKYQNVFDMVLDISEVDSSLAKGNLAYYLSKLPGKIKNYNTFFPELEKFVKENFTKASLIDMLCGDDTYGVHKGLVGNHVPLTENSQLIYSYAVSIPNSSWTFKHQKFPGGLIISTGSSNYEEVYEEFTKTEIWKRINISPQSRKKFAEEILNGDLKENPFYEMYPPFSGIEGIREVKWDNLKAFVNQLSKDDVDLAQFIMDDILSKVPNDKKDSYASQALQIVNLALGKELQKDLPIGQIKEKKMKL
jgi:hypothetical protein